MARTTSSSTSVKPSCARRRPMPVPSASVRVDRNSETRASVVRPGPETPRGGPEGPPRVTFCCDLRLPGAGGRATARAGDDTGAGVGAVRVLRDREDLRGGVTVGVDLEQGATGR